MQVAIDIDSTLHHYWDQLAAVAQRRFGVVLPYDEQRTWAIERLTAEQLSECIAETHGAELVLSAEPYPDAVEVIGAWRAAGHTIHIASHRAPDAHAHTARWLAGIGLAFDELRCDYGKVDWAADAGVGLLVDDSPLGMAPHAGLVKVGTWTSPWSEPNGRPLCGAPATGCGARSADLWNSSNMVLSQHGLRPAAGDESIAGTCLAVLAIRSQSPDYARGGRHETARALSFRSGLADRV